MNTDKTSLTDKILHHLVRQQAQATPEQLAQLVNQAATAPFATDLLEVDKPLWGGFWHFDVISPGYILPAVELALLRAVRLDGHWPKGTSVEQFLADLHQAISHPQVGVWTLAIIEEPCAVFAAPTKEDAKSELEQQNRKSKNHRASVQNPQLVTVAWYCATTGQLHAGYQATVESLHFAGAIEQRELIVDRQFEPATVDKPSWLAQVTGQRVLETQQSLVARLDTGILDLRSGRQPASKNFKRLSKE